MKIILVPAIASFSFIIYIKTLAPTVLMADGGEFQFVPYLAGIPHPTGYPLYIMLGWLWSHLLPFGDVAYRMNLFSALWAAVSVGLFYLAAEEIARPLVPEPLAILGAALGALSLAFSETFWSQATIAEVYSLNGVFVAGIFYMLLAGRHSLPLIAFVYGLSLTHHRSMVLFLPAMVAFLWLEGKLHGKDPAFWLKVLLSFLAPLAIYLYIPLRAPHTPYLRLPLSEKETLILYHNTLKGFLNHVLGQPFAGALSLPDAARLEQAALLFKGQFGWWGPFLGAVGLARLLFSRKWSCLVLTTLTFLTIIAFNLCYAIGDVYVLFISAYFIFALWLGLGAATLAEGVGWGISRWKGSPVRYGMWEKGYQKVIAGIKGMVSNAVGILLLALPLSLLVFNFGRLDRSGDYAARDFWREILEAPPPEEAILVSNDRDEMMPLWYMQYVEGGRPDLLGLFPLIVPEPGYQNIGQLVDILLERTGRPVYLIKDMPGLEIKYKLRQVGPLVEVLSPAVMKEPDYPLEITLAESIRLLGYDLWPQIARPGGELRAALHWQGMRKMGGNFSSFVHLLDVEGRRWASSDHLPGGDYYPTSFWQPGEILRDEHRLSLPADIPPGIYRLRAGMYLLPSLQPLGENIVLGEVEIEISN
ncbi:MAG: glycosyltransferase family 117 protein [Anaerolineae bacterium]